MTLNIIIIVLSGILLPFLLYYEYRENRKGLLPTKTALSALFVMTPLVQPHPIPFYYHVLLIGLLFCLGGDVFLALPQDKMFRLGLVSFLIGHIFYIIGFFGVACI
ncbi:MAG: lysoplasmalogenase, partial [Proteobacteria bacterium]|nr:lysoplasmalogenase [Pseudomonadota bacterium]